MKAPVRWWRSVVCEPPCVWLTLDPGSFNTPLPLPRPRHIKWLDNGTQYPWPGLLFACDLSDGARWNLPRRTKTQKRPQCRDQHSNLCVICPQSASTSPPTAVNYQHSLPTRLPFLHVWWKCRRQGRRLIRQVMWRCCVLTMGNTV